MRFDFDSANGICTLAASDLLRGSGAPSLLRHVLSHADLKGVALRFEPSADIEFHPPATYQALWDLVSNATVPVAASIRGACQHASAGLTLACHFRIALCDVAFSSPGLGLSLPPACLAVLAQQNVLRRALAEVVLSEHVIDADEALAVGLVDQVVEDDPDAAAVRYLESLVGNRPPRVVRAVMESIRNARKLPREDALRKEAELFLKVVEQAMDVDEAATR